MARVKESKCIILEMVDFGCPSCARAIEQAGRRIAGVQEIRVDLAQHEIRVTCDAKAEPTAALTALVQRLGHDLRPRKAGPES